MEAIGWDSLWVALGLLALGLLLAVAVHNLIELRQHRKAGEVTGFWSRSETQEVAERTATPVTSEHLAEAVDIGSPSILEPREVLSVVQNDNWDRPTVFEVAIRFECLGRMPEAVLNELRTVRRIGSKPVRCIEGPGFHQACLAIALAGRSGSLNLLELDEFSARCDELAASLELTITSSSLDPLEVIRLARQAEEQLLALDAQVQFNLVTDRAPSLASIERAARHAGLLAWGKGRFFMQHEGSDDIVFSVLPGDQGALLGFMMDLPRVDEPARAWSAMVVAARSIQQSLGGQLVDERNVTLDERAFAVIATQIQQRVRALVDAGLVPGGDLSKRIFT